MDLRHKYKKRRRKPLASNLVRLTKRSRSSSSHQSQGPKRDHSAGVLDDVIDLQGPRWRGWPFYVIVSSKYERAHVHRPRPSLRSTCCQKQKREILGASFMGAASAARGMVAAGSLCGRGLRLEIGNSCVGRPKERSFACQAGTPLDDGSRYASYGAKRGLLVGGKKEQLRQRLEEAAVHSISAAQAFRNAHAEALQSPETLDDSVLDTCLETVFGHTSLRGWQSWAVKRILRGESCLVVQPTGSGKSICYQLPSLSLLQTHDRRYAPNRTRPRSAERLAPSLPGACLHGGLKHDEVSDIVARLKAKAIKILYLAPERLFSASFRRLVAHELFPPVGIMCIDEAHCLSSWSHNFRPSYLRVSEAQ